MLDLYGDFGLSLGGASEPLGSLMGTSWAALGASWCILGAPWRPLGEFLGGFNGSSTCSTSNLLHYITCFKELFISRAGARKSSICRPPGGLLSTFWGLLGTSCRLLGPLWSVLEASWRRLGSHVGPLEALKAKMMIFLWFYKGLAAQLPRHGRQRGSEPEPWRG